MTRLQVTDTRHLCAFLLLLLLFFKGSTRFGSFCYDIGSEAKTFNEAKQACSGAGGYLVDVTNR